MKSYEERGHLSNSFNPSYPTQTVYVRIFFIKKKGKKFVYNKDEVQVADLIGRPREH